jgi:hypothetical protein
MPWSTLALPPAPPLAEPKTPMPPAAPAPPAAVPSSEALCSARLSVLKVLVVVSAAALCVVKNPIAAAATKIAATIGRLV